MGKMRDVVVSYSAKTRPHFDEPAPEFVALFARHLGRLDWEGRGPDLDRDSRVFLQVVVPVRIRRSPALGRSDDRSFPSGR